jgi:hypothetical protein
MGDPKKCQSEGVQRIFVAHRFWAICAA